MGSALDARGIKSSPDNLVAHVEGIIENVDGVALIDAAQDAATAAWRRFVAKYGGIMAG